MLPQVLDKNKWFSQDDSIAKLLRESGVETITFAGEYARACVDQAKGNFPGFRVIENTGLEYQP